MGLTLKGAIVGRKKLGTPKEGRSQFYAWLLRCPDGTGDFEVCTSDIVGGAGEIVEIPVKAEINKTMGTVQYSPLRGSGFETEWDVDDAPAKPAAKPGNISALLANTMTPNPLPLSQDKPLVPAGPPSSNGRG